MVHATVTVQFQASKVTVILQDCFAWGSALGVPLCTRRLVLMAELPGADGEGCSVKRASDKWRRSIERQGIAFRSCVLYLIEFVAFRHG